MCLTHIDAGVDLLTRTSKQKLWYSQLYCWAILVTSTKPKCYNVLDSVLLNATTDGSISVPAWPLDTSGHEFNLIPQSRARIVGNAGTRAKRSAAEAIALAGYGLRPML